MANQFKLSAVAILCSVGLAACGGSSSSDETAEMASFSFAVSDAAVDDAETVMVCFSSVELVGNGGSPQRFTVGGDDGAVEPNDACLDVTGNVIPNTKGVDLLTLQGASAEALVTNAEVPAGNYGQMRLALADEGSFVQLKNGDVFPLEVPSETVRLDGVTLTANQTFNYTLEFDLRRAVIAPPGLDNYVLKPRGLRLVDNAEVGHIDGLVAESLLMEAGCPVAPENIEEAVAAVYLFEGHELPLEELTDNNDENSAYASIAVFFDGATDYSFEIGYVEAGDYTLAVTCNTKDDPEAADNIVFEHAENINVEADTTLEIIVGAD